MNNEFLVKKMIDKIVVSTKKLLLIENEILEISNLVAKKINSKGRIILIGAGLSSEMARIIIDELWFNFQIKRGKFVAMTAAKEYAQNLVIWKELEEVYPTSIFELDEMNINKNDLVIGLSSSGKTQYVISALKYSHDVGCVTVLITDIDNINKLPQIDYKIDTKFGYPVIMGLNTAEGGTIQKIILDLIFYNAMLIIGRIWRDSLVFMKPVSKKIEKYCVEVIMKIMNYDVEKAMKVFLKNNRELETTLISEIKQINYNEAKKVLKKFNYNFNKIVSD